MLKEHEGTDGSTPDGHGNSGPLVENAFTRDDALTQILVKLMEILNKIRNSLRL